MGTGRPGAPLRTRCFNCLLVSGAAVLGFEYLELEVQEEKTGLEVEMQESSACGGYL